MITIAHRGNVFGKTDKENQLLYLMKAVRAGFGVETDVLRAPCGRLIVSHDPAEWTPLNDAQLVLRNLLMNDAYIALNVKEEGLIEDLIKIFDPSKMRGFAFDFELCCSKPEDEMVKYAEAGFEVAARYSDRGERPSTFAEYIWLDEMDKSGSLDLSHEGIGWAGFRQECDRIIYVSPELHGRPVSERRTEKFHGICTDYCIAL
jgi:glycerophosphoryl diester phosphodiesterase